MADDYAGRLLAFTHQEYQKEITEGTQKQCVEMQILEKAGCIESNCSGGASEWRHRYQDSTSGIGFSGTETLNYDARNDYVKPSLPWRGLADGISVGWAELLENRGHNVIMDLLEVIPEDLRANAITMFCTDFHLSGTTRNSKTFHGLAAALGTSAGTYAGISQSSVSAWDNQRVDATASGGSYLATPTSLIRQLIHTCAVGNRGGRDRSMLTHILCSNVDYRVAADYLEARQRGPLTGDVELAKAGFPNFQVDGVTVVWSEFMTSMTKMWGLNTKHLKLRVCTENPFQFFHQQPTGAPNPHLFYFLSHFNLQVRNPRAMGVLYSTTS